MKKTFTRACLGLFALVCCFLISQAHTSASLVKDAGSQNSFTQNSFTKNEEIEGDLEIIAECEENYGRTLYFVNTASGRVQIQFPSGVPSTSLTTGSHVRADGNYVGSAFVVSDGVEKLDSGSNNVLPSTTGEHKALVILVNFQDKQTQPYTVEQARDVAFNQTSNYFREASHGQTWLTGDVYGWFTIPVGYATCDTSLISTYAQQAASNAGADLSAYDHLVYEFPYSPGCGFSGLATIGAGVTRSQVWLNQGFELHNLAHELGHNLGLFHSRSMDCGTVVIGPNCTTSEYGDVMDTMGMGDTAHYNLFQKEQLGWALAQAVSASGSYWIDAYETMGGTKGLKVLKSTDPITGARTWYYLEHRTPYGFDGTLSNNVNVMTGILLRIGTELDGQTSYLLDTTPMTSSWSDPALTVGQVFSDSSAGVTITTLSADATGSLVNVVVAPQACVRSNPTLTVSQAQGPSVPSGSVVGFNLSVRNNDSSGCGSSTFTLQAPVLANWNAVFDAPRLVLNSGASDATTLRITSPVGAADGSYPISVSAVNSSNATSVSSMTVNYSVMSALAVTAAATQASYTRNQIATVNATVRAGGTPVSGATVTFSMTKSNGVVLTSTRTTGANGIAVFTYALSRKKDPTGTYQVRAQANASGMSGFGTTNFTVR